MPEACGGSHYRGRVARAPGHEVRPIPPRYVEPFVERGKDDPDKAEAAREAASRPTTRPVPARSAESRAEDAPQQVFVAAWKALQRGDDVRDVRPWLLRIARNTALNTLRVPGYDHGELTESLQVGDPAPAFTLASDGGRSIDSQALAGRRYVLFFYPKDAPPGCTREVCAFRDDMKASSIWPEIHDRPSSPSPNSF